MILFVCTGNTCRSPMAAAIARAAGVDAGSAGLYALPGDCATPQAVRAAALYGGDLTGHRARPVTAGLMAEAEAVYAMTAAHAAELARRFPSCQRKIRVLSPAIPDPFGGSDAVYAQCAGAIHRSLANAGLL